MGRSSGKVVELKKLSELHRRLEDWRNELPKEFEPKEGQLPNVILMHMFFHLQYIHLFRPFLKYAPSASPLPPHVSPRRICTANAGAISKLLRLYKKLWNLRQICNIAVYMVHSACTIHLLNLPEKTARRDITHGLKHLEEIAEDWLCARRTLSILSVLARKWNCELPEEAAIVLQRADERYGTYSTSDVPSPRSNTTASPASDGGMGFKSAGDYSPLTQYTRTQLSRPVRQSSATERMMTSTPLAAVGSSQMAQRQGIPLDTPSLNFGNDAMASWRQSPVSSGPSYPSTFAPIAQPTMTTAPSQPMVRPNSPSRSMRMDSQEWFLNDSARWHQSFEAWQMANGSQDASVFMFGDSGNTGTPNTNPESMPSDSNDQISGFEGLGTSLGGSGWLPGLD